MVVAKRGTKSVGRVDQGRLEVEHRLKKKNTTTGRDSPEEKSKGHYVINGAALRIPPREIKISQNEPKKGPTLEMMRHS